MVTLLVNIRPIVGLTSSKFGLQGPIFSNCINCKEYIDSKAGCEYEFLHTETIPQYELIESIIEDELFCFLGGETLTLDVDGTFIYAPYRYYYWMDAEENTMKDFFREVFIPEDVFIRTDNGCYANNYNYNHYIYIENYIQWIMSYNWGKYMEQYFETDPSKQQGFLQVPIISYEDWYENWTREGDSDKILKEYARKHKDICSSYIWGKYYMEEYFETDPDLY